MNNPLKRVAYAWITVHVEDINDHPPVMSRDIYEISIQEHSAIGQYVIQVDASDEDEVSSWTYGLHTRVHV